MPWINEELCTGCRLCLAECSVGAISVKNGSAFIEQGECIRCGVCHDVCPSYAVRHDGERIPEEVQANLAWARSLLEHEYYLNDGSKQKKLIERLQRFFAKDRKVAEKTIEELGSWQNSD